MSKQCTSWLILIALSISHLYNDTVQALLPAIYPLLKKTYDLSFTEVGIITFVFQMVSSVLQPCIGFYADTRSQPYSLAVSMTITFIGIMILGLASTYSTIIVVAGLFGLASAIFHPEASRSARLASGGKYGLAQSFLQAGGNAGTAIAPLLAAFIIIPYGAYKILWLAPESIIFIVILLFVGAWYARILKIPKPSNLPAPIKPHNLSRRTVIISLGILLSLIFSKHFYITSMMTFYIFYLIGKFHISLQQAQMLLFLFSGSIALGTIVGGPIGDRFGRKLVIWISILGVSPFTIALPYMNLLGTAILSIIIGFMLASAFSSIVVYGTDLLPNHVGLISGLFFGTAFGVGGIGAAILGKVADMTSINFVYYLCSIFPLIGIVTIWLPNLSKKKISAL